MGAVPAVRWEANVQGRGSSRTRVFAAARRGQGDGNIHLSPGSGAWIAQAWGQRWISP